MMDLRRQFRSNAVALISLTVALSSLGYNTWRNERTERNRNVRTATFELLLRLADLERVTFLAHYDRDASGGNPRTGWTYVLAISDLATLVPPPVPARADDLRKAWSENWQDLGQDGDAAVDRVDDAIGRLRAASLDSLRGLR